MYIEEMTTSVPNPQSIPVVDLKHFTRKDKTRTDTEDLAQELCDAFKTWGFAYIINHSIPSEEVEAARRASARFFELPVSTKQQFERVGNQSREDIHGWCPMEKESINPNERPGDYKEFFDVIDFKSERWPEKDVPELKQAFRELNHSFEETLLDMLYLMGVGLKLDNTELFVNCHRFGAVQTLTTLRSIYYPRNYTALRDKQVACGEHTDFGSLTLLIQDDVGGLQVFDQTQGRYVDAVPIAGSIVVNIGDFMQRWTSDVLISTKHRVIIPKSTASSPKPRQSIAFFGNPEPAFVIECVDGSGKYPPITSWDHIKMRLERQLKSYV